MSINKDVIVSLDWDFPFLPKYFELLYLLIHYNYYKFVHYIGITLYEPNIP